MRNFIANIGKHFFLMKILDGKKILNPDFKQKLYNVICARDHLLFHYFTKEIAKYLCFVTLFSRNERETI